MVTKIEYPVKRICEQTFHPEAELKAYQECPFCRSESFHRVVILKETTEV